MKGTIETWICYGEDDLDVSIDYEYIPGEPEVWTLSNGDPGNPGTSSEVNILGIYPMEDIEEVCISESMLSIAEFNRIEELIIDKHES